MSFAYYLIEDGKVKVKKLYTKYNEHTFNIEIGKKYSVKCFIKDKDDEIIRFIKYLN